MHLDCIIMSFCVVFLHFLSYYVIMYKISAYSLLISCIVALGACKYMEQSILQGQVYTIQNGDTIYLDSVIIDFYNTEKYRGSVVSLGRTQDFQYMTTSNSNGKFWFAFKYAPTESVYELTFRRHGYVFASQQFYIEYDELQERIVRNQELEVGVLRDVYYQKFQKIIVSEEGDLWLAVVIGGILTVLLFVLIFNGDRINIYIMDAIRNRRRKK